MAKKIYDIALSFAGEQRDFVREVAAYLLSYNINVFYDEFEQTQLWGEDLYEKLYKIYSNQARYCVIFISKDYKEKIWTRHELRSALENRLYKKKEAILPVRFDATILESLPKTLSFIDLVGLSPVKLARLILQKLKIKSCICKQENREKVVEFISSYWCKHSDNTYVLNDNGKKSIKKFLEKLKIDEILEAIDIASIKLNNIDKIEERFKYFCGICHNKISTNKTDEKLSYRQICKKWQSYNRGSGYFKEREFKEIYELYSEVEITNAMDLCYSSGSSSYWNKFKNILGYENN